MRISNILLFLALFVVSACYAQTITLRVRLTNNAEYDLVANLDNKNRTSRTIPYRLEAKYVALQYYAKAANTDINRVKMYYNGWFVFLFLLFFKIFLTRILIDLLCTFSGILDVC